MFALVFIYRFPIGLFRIWTCDCFLAVYTSVPDQVEPVPPYRAANCVFPMAC